MSIDAAAMRLWDGIAVTPVKVATTTPSVDVEAVAKHEAQMLAKVRREVRKVKRQTNTLVRQLRHRETPDGQVVPRDATPYRTRQHARTHTRPVGWNKGTGNGARNPQPLASVATPDAHSVGFGHIMAVEYTRTVERQRSKTQALADKTERRRLKRIRRSEARGVQTANPTLQVTPIASHWA